MRDLVPSLRTNRIEPHVIGGAALAAELDAKRAIKQGTELATRLYTSSLCRERACLYVDTPVKTYILRTLAQEGSREAGWVRRIKT